MQKTPKKTYSSLYDASVFFLYNIFLLMIFSLKKYFVLTCMFLVIFVLIWCGEKKQIDPEIEQSAQDILSEILPDNISDQNTHDTIQISASSWSVTLTTESWDNSSNTADILIEEFKERGERGGVTETNNNSNILSLSLSQESQSVIFLFDGEYLIMDIALENISDTMFLDLTRTQNDQRTVVWEKKDIPLVETDEETLFKEKILSKTPCEKQTCEYYLVNETTLLSLSVSSLSQTWIASKRYLWYIRPYLETITTQNESLLLPWAKLVTE